MHVQLLRGSTYAASRQIVVTNKYRKDRQQMGLVQRDRDATKEREIEMHTHNLRLFSLSVISELMALRMFLSHFVFVFSLLAGVPG